MSDYSNVIQGMFGQEPKAQVTANIDVNPDESARAYDLEKVTGVPSSIISGDVDSFESQHKAQMASDIVGGNPYLGQYVNSHSLASQISNDDYGTLDTISQSLLRLPKVNAVYQSFKGILQSYGKDFTSGFDNVSEDEFKNHPLRASAQAGLNTLAGIGQTTLNAPFEFAVENLGRIARAMSGSDEVGQEVSEKAANIIDAGTMALVSSGLPIPEIPASGLLKALPWLKDGKVPPHGIDPALDAAKLQINQDGLKVLDEAVKESQKSTTKERAPELFGDFVQQHIQDTRMGISGQRALELYGDKVPEADDGILGWVPDIDKQLEVARDTGADISVPMKDWIANVDPEVHKELQDDLRIVDGGMTNREAKEHQELRQAEIETANKLSLDQRLGKLDEEKVTNPNYVAGAGPENRYSHAIDAATGFSTPGDLTDWAPHIQWALENGREDIAQALVERAEREAERSRQAKPGVDKELNPEKYAKIEGDLAKRGAESTEQAKQLRGSLPAKENESKPVVDEAVPILRNNAGLEPLFSIGDRKLQLNKLASKSEQFGEAQGFHDFDMINENGQSVGTLNLSEQKGGKELYVDNINGLGDYYHPNNFGPALMRDLLRQIKAAFPNAEMLTGHRVSGVRGAAETFGEAHAFPKIKLSEFEPNGVEKFSKLLGGAWHSIGDDGLQAYIKPEYAQHEQDLIYAVHSELDTIVPKGVAVQPASELRYGAKRPTGAYQQQPGEIPVIAWALNSHDPIGIARHEAIHHLRQAGFFEPAEWSALEQASKAEGWGEKFNIERRYSQLDEAGKTEESVADAYKQWAEEHELRQSQPQTPIDKIFQKVKDFLDAIKAHVRRITGSENFDDIFNRVHSGEVGSRDVAEAGGEGTALSEPPISEPGQGIDPRSPFRAAKDVGMTLDQHKNYMKLIEQRQQSDLKASVDRVLAEQSKRQSAEWKAQGEAMRPEVMAALNARPDIAADKFFGLGELMGQKLDKTYRLDWEALTPEQRKAIPESYTVRKGGVKPDEVAGLFGYKTGDQMIDGLAKTTQAREISGVRRDRFLRKIADDEIQRRMEVQHGFLEKNIEEDTKDQVLSENQLNLLHEETHHLALMSGQQEVYYHGSPTKGIKEFQGPHTFLTKDPEVARRYADRQVIGTKSSRVVEGNSTVYKVNSSHTNTFDLRNPEHQSIYEDLRKQHNSAATDPDDRLPGLRSEGFLQSDSLPGYGNARKILELAEKKGFDSLRVNEGSQGESLLTKSEMVKPVLEQGFDLTRDQLTSVMKEKFDALPVGAISSDKFLREAGKHGRLAELSLLQNKPADAYRSKQVQYFNTVYADMARVVEKAKAKLDKAAKPFRKQDIKNIEPEYLNHIQDLLQQAGYKVGRSVDNIQENLQRREKTVEQFANEKLADSFGYRDIPIADVIVDNAVKPVDQMSAHDFMGFKQTVDALIKNAKDEQKIIKAGESADRREVLDNMKDLISRFESKPINQTKTKWDKLKELPRNFLAGLTNMETFLNRMGDRDPESVFNKYVTYPAAAASNRKASLQREFSKIYRDIGEVKDKDKLVPSPLIDPLSQTKEDPEGQPFARFTRGNVAQMLHNAGNKSNWTVLAKGYAADPDKLMNWLVANTTKEDWARAQDLGKNVFGRLIKLADQEYEHIHGITIDKLKLEPITNAHGTFEGWYHPLVKDPLREGKSPIRDGAYDDSDFGHITTANGYTKKRSGAAYPLDLNPDMTPVRMNQMIHDISFRSFVLETQKLFKDPGLSNTITNHYGAEYNGRSFLLPWLKGIAGQESIPSRAAAKASQLSEYLRQNVISTYIGMNPFTAMKHGPTAAVMSMRQVGSMNFLRAVQDLYGRSPELTLSNSEFAMKHSEELQRRERHWQDTIFGAHGEITGATSVRERIIEKGSWLVAKSDMMSAKPTWLAEYGNAQGEGLTHGESIDRADAAVRLAHGSTAITNQPGLVRGQGAIHNWLTSVYGFFGTAMQRRIELAQDIHDTFGLAKQGELNKAAANIPSIMSDTFAYVIWPTIVEEAVTGTTTDDRRGWGEHVAMASLLGLSSSVLYARDIVNGLISGHDVGVGLISSPLHDVVKAVKDVTRKDALTRQRMGRTIGDTLTAFGHLSGMAPKTLDNAIHFGIDLVNGVAHPHSAGDWLRGFTKGTTKERVEK